MIIPLKLERASESKWWCQWVSCGGDWAGWEIELIVMCSFEGGRSFVLRS